MIDTEDFAPLGKQLWRIIMLGNDPILVGSANHLRMSMRNYRRIVEHARPDEQCRLTIIGAHIMNQLALLTERQWLAERPANAA